MNETEQNKKTTSGQSEISTLKDSQTSNTENFDNMDRENFYHWGATCEIMDIIRRRNNSPESRRLVDQRNALSRPGTLRRRYDHQTQRTVFAPSRPNKRSREEITEKDAELIRRANRLGGGYQPLTEEQEEQTDEVQEEENWTTMRQRKTAWLCEAITYQLWIYPNTTRKAKKLNIYR